MIGDLLIKLFISYAFTVILLSEPVLGYMAFDHFYKSLAWGFIGQSVSLMIFIYQKANEAIDKETPIKFTNAHYVRIVVGLFGSPVLAVVISAISNFYFPKTPVMIVSICCGLFFEYIAQRGFMKKMFDRFVNKNLPE